MEKEWFKSWFDSPFYHILYQNRDETEARNFVINLIRFLQPPQRARILDLACGKGRFSVQLANMGFEVVGLDLSIESIEFARQFETDSLSFFTHDMRQPFRVNFFDFIFNFFTSFGYFESEKDHLETLKNANKGMRSGGVFVLDYFNAEKVISDLIPEQTKSLEGINFRIRKKISKGYILKNIQFENEGKEYAFTERVRAFSLDDLQTLFRNAGFEIQHYFGDYSLQPFEVSSSDRLIIIAKKTI